MDLRTVLNNAQSPDHHLRTQAELFLQQALDAQYGPFVVALCTEFGTEGLPDESRQLAGLYLKNLLSANDQQIMEAKKQKWLSCDPSLKEQIRAMLLHPLQSPVHVVRRTAAQVLAAFGSVDVPTSSWPTLVPSLMQGVITPEAPDSIRMASLETLGYMCDQMDPDEIAPEVTNQILSAIIDGLRADRPIEVRQVAILALHNSLDFTSANFQIEQERDQIVAKVIEACQAPDLKCRKVSFDCFARIAELYYEHLPRYVQSIFNLTTTAIASDSGESGLNAMEFWCTICEEEVNRDYERQEGNDEVVLHYIAVQAAPVLVPILLETLTKQSDDVDDEDDWNIAKAGSTCLDLLAQVVKDPIVDLVLPFIQQHIQSPEWRLKEASIMTFGAIVDGPSPEKLTPIVSAAVPVLIASMQDGHPIVRDTAAWVISRICGFQKGALTPETLGPLVSTLTALLDDAHITVVNQACNAIHELAAACAEDRDKPSNILSSFMGQMLTKLFAVTARVDDSEGIVNLRVSAYEAIMMLIENSAEDMAVVAQQVMQETVVRLQQTFNPHLDATDRANAQTSLCDLLHVCIQKLPKESIDQPSADKIMELMITIFSSNAASAQSDAYIVMGYLADKREADFSRYIAAVHPILVQGLKRVDEAAVCRAAVGLTGDLCRAVKTQMKPCCDDIMHCLIQLLQSPTLDKEIKPEVISCFADISMAIEGDFDRYVGMILEMLRQAGEVEVPDNDEDLQEYVFTLHTAILEAYSGILQGLKDSGKQDVLVPALESINAFLNRSAGAEDRPSEVVKAACGLIGDLAQTFGNRMLQMFAQPFITQILQNGLADEDEGVQQIASWAQRLIRKP